LFKYLAKHENIVFQKELSSAPYLIYMIDNTEFWRQY